MPKTTKSGDARQDEIPSTLQRSDEKAQRTFAKAHDSAMDSYDDEQRANQVAWAAVKHTHQKVADHWVKKPRAKKGPSDLQAEGGRDTDRETKGGVDVNASKTHLYDRPKERGTPGRARVSRVGVVDARQKPSEREAGKPGEPR